MSSRAEREEAPRMMQRDQEAWCEVSPLEGPMHRLRLGGRFPRRWVGSLCASLSEHGISVETLHARRTLPRPLMKPRQADASSTIEIGGEWVAEGRLRVLSGRANVAELPYLRWALSPAVQMSMAPALRSFKLLDGAGHPGGVLCLVIEADDVLGLLGNLVEAVRALGLWPEELHIDTAAGRAHDKFWLTTQQGLAPSEETRKALERWLQGQVVRGPRTRVR